MSLLAPLFDIFATILSGRMFGRYLTVAIVVLFATMVLPRSSFEIPGVSNNVSVTVFGLSIALIIVLFSAPRTLITARFVPFLVFSVMMIGFGWHNPDANWESFFPYLCAVLAAGLGAFAARGSGEVGSRFAQGMLVAILSVVVLQFSVSLGQYFGADLFPVSSESAQLESGRARGTLGHPGTYGKIGAFLVAILLPLTTVLGKRSRKFSYFGVLLIIITTGLTESRTNFIVVIGMTVLWVLMIRGRGQLGKRVLFGTAIVLVSLISLDTIISRFSGENSVGGQRTHLLSVALQYIPDHLWLGVGPGNYVEYFGQFDSLTAQGWPVHNIFFHVIAEFGVIGAILFFLPFALMLTGAFRDYLKRGDHAPYALALKIASIGVIAIGLVSWGILSGFVLYAWFFVFGYLNASRIQQREGLSLPTHQGKTRGIKPHV